jgi:photosystem II stability/assembly factor-like uncharacterized protein
VRNKEQEVSDQSELEKLYLEAQSALKAKDYNRATDLLRQILVIDENYKDVSRLLAQMVKLKRRRWFNHPMLWGVFGVVVIFALGFFISPRLKGMYAVQPTVSAVIKSPTATLPPAIIATSTETLVPTPTPVPLTWKRISTGQEFQRDTVTAFATDKKDPDVIYAGMQNAGVYKTIDGGLSWRPAHQGLASTQVESLLIDSQNPQILYAGTMGGVFKTEDGGENWFRIGDGTYLLMDLQNNSHLYARDEGGIYKTTDRGNTWKTVYALKKDCPDAIHSWAIHPANGEMIFIGGGETCAGVYKSTNSGGAWASLGLEDKPDIDTLGIGQDVDGNISIYVYYDSPSVPDWGMYTLRDGNENWSFTQNIECNLIASDLENPDAIYCHDSSSLYVLRNDGTPWKLVSGSQSKFYSAIHIDHPNDTERIITSGTNVASQFHPYVSIFISTDGGATWIERISGIGSAHSELKIDSINSDNMYLAAYYMGDRASINCTLFRSLDGGKSWSSIKVRADWCGPTFDTTHVLYMTESGSLQTSQDGGESWLWGYRGVGAYDQKKAAAEEAKAIANRLPVEAQSVSANPYVDGLIYAVGDTILFSTSGSVPREPTKGSEGSWDGRLFYTDQSKFIFDIGRYHQKYSTNNGKTWQACGEDITTSRSDSRLALDLQGSRLYLATPGQGVLVSTNKCGSWQPSNNGLSNLFVNTLAVDPNNSNTIYAGTDGGEYISYDSGGTWGQVNDGLLGATVVYSIAVDKDSNVYASTPYGIFKLENK